MNTVVYICTGTCKAEISEEEYAKGLTKCGADGCTHFGHAFEKRLKCGVCGQLFEVTEEHKH